ncbi:MAG: hypothetical protein M3N93_07620 [Acidobacteriota bacterium]|nr:hypothetical protein [Acidobacteriota bacterium]
MNKRLVAAMGAYAVLIALAAYLLRGVFLSAVLTLFLLLIVRTLIALKAGWVQTGSIPVQTVPGADSNSDRTPSLRHPSWR